MGKNVLGKVENNNIIIQILNTNKKIDLKNLKIEF